MASVTRSGKRWRAQVRRVGRAPLSRSFDTKQDAQRWAREMEGAIAAGRDPGQRQLTPLSQIIAAYRLVAAVPLARSRTRRTALAMLERELGGVRVQDFAPSVLLSFAERRARQGASPPTILMDLSHLRSALRHGAVALSTPDAPLSAAPLMNVLSEAVALLRSTGRVSDSRQRDRRPTDAELARLRDHWSANPPDKLPMWALTRFAIATALRLGEIVRIDWDGYDPAGRTIRVRDRKTPVAGEKVDQRVPLLVHARICGELVDPVALMGERKARGRVFPVAGASVSNAFIRACAAAGVEDLTFHDLRHDAISRLFEAGLDIPRVQLSSGHRSWKHLQRYVQLRPEDVHDYLRRKQRDN